MPPDPPDYSAALQAIKIARQNGKTLSAEEESEFLVSRVKSRITILLGIEIKTRRGQTVFRKVGKAGADLLVHPEEWKNKKKQRDFEAEKSKMFRFAPDPQKGVATRQAQAEILANKIVKLAIKYEYLGRHRAAKIADEVRKTAKHVRAVLKQKRT